MVKVKFIRLEVLLELVLIYCIDVSILKLYVGFCVVGIGVMCVFKIGDLVIII